MILPSTFFLGWLVGLCRQSGGYGGPPCICGVAVIAGLSGWRFGVVVSVVDRINEVNQHRARLVL